jgi:hypothetical protein
MAPPTPATRPSTSGPSPVAIVPVPSHKDPQIVDPQIVEQKASRGAAGATTRRTTASSVARRLAFPSAPSSSSGIFVQRYYWRSSVSRAGSLGLSLIELRPNGSVDNASDCLTISWTRELVSDSTRASVDVARFFRVSLESLVMRQHCDPATHQRSRTETPARVNET